MSFGDHDDDDIPMENLQPPPGNRGRRTSSIHLDVAELTLLSANRGSWIAQESLHHNTELDNEYYHRINEAPFRKRFANFSDYSMGTSGKQVPGNKRGFYSGQQTAYFVDDNVSDDNVIGEYTRPSLYQLMKHYQPKHRPIPMTTGKGGQTLPPIRHTNTPVDGTAGPTSKEWRYRNPSGEPDNNETMETRNGTPDSGENNTHTNRKEVLYSKKVPPENTCVDERPLKMPIDTGFTSELGLVVKAGDKPIKVGQKENSTYEKRIMYGKNLEKNWFSEHIQKKLLPVSPREEIGDISDLFYSPCYTESEGESDAENVKPVTDKKRHPIEAGGDLFSSTDVLMGEAGELEESTASEYEIIIKNNVLMEKKTKHKMRRKRQRKRDRYLKLVETQTTTDPDISHLTDTQLRAMRLKLAKRHAQPRLKGKRKFLQVANAVFVAMQFAKILKKLRKAKKLKRKSLRKSQKSLKQGSEDAYDEFERKPTPFSLKTEFLKTIGDKLIRDVSNLNIKDEDNTCETSNGTTTLTHLDTSIEHLLANVSEGPQPHRLAHRRGSDSTLLARPKLFPIEVYETTKVRRRDMSKHVAMPKSSTNRSLSCDRNRKCTCPRGRANGHSKSARCAVHGVYRGFKVKEKIIMFDRDEVLKQRRPSLDMDKIKSGEAIDLRDLLAGIDIPAKEIKIQIALRKMRRRKMRQSNRPDIVDQTAVVLRPRFDFDEVIVPPKTSSQKTLHCERTQERLQSGERNELKDEFNNVSLPYQTDDEPPYDGSPEQPITAYDASDDTKCSFNTTTLEPIKSYVKSRNSLYSFSSPAKPIMSYGGLSWDPTTAPARPRYSDKEIAEEMERVSSLMLQMKDCRYIRWTPFHQAVIARMEKNNYQNTVC